MQLCGCMVQSESVSHGAYDYLTKLIYDYLTKLIYGQCLFCT